MTQWQPIETAPKDGTEILTIRDNGFIAKAVWYDNPFGRKDTVIDNASGKWWSVTHWVPLPAPPAAPRRLVWMPEAQQIKSPMMARHIKARDATRAAKP